MSYGRKWCIRCRAAKPIVDFMAKRGYTEYAYCRDCMSAYQKNHRDATRSTTIPLTCAICFTPFSNDIRPKWDHDHNTDKERDWLCQACNVAIGNMDDNPILLLQAIEYLRFHSEPNMTVFVDSKILTAFGVADEERCVCGGIRNVVHCPDCGSTQCYANRRSNPEAILPGANTKTQVRAFRCKLCSKLFSEVDTVNACKAKKNWQRSVEQEKRVNKVVEKASPETLSEVEEAVRRLKIQRGLLPAPPVVDPTIEDLMKPPILDEETSS